MNKLFINGNLYIDTDATIVDDTVNKDWKVIDFLKTVPTIIEADNAESEI